MTTKRIELDAQERTDLRRGANGRARRIDDFALGVVYGGVDKPVPISIAHSKILKATESEAFFTQILDLNLNGKKQSVLLKDVQRHPYKKRILHLDFLRVNAHDIVNVRLPLHFVNESNCAGIKLGGILEKLLSDVEVTCKAGNIPEFIEVDLSHINLDQTLHLSDLKLPHGAQATELEHGHDLAVAMVQKPKSDTE